ncbi:hypothetical protein CHS0354_001243 [Potamilus streckersoni]|uniref:RNA helicase n=1 Tax=Potamilus streckersoni TaxID=2493646 RepID=A0AAE0S3Z4_9BIVA|nr:hypothetical protein CHS0354_001243 [Potamilus streckersoni]
MILCTESSLHFPDGYHERRGSECRLFGKRNTNQSVYIFDISEEMYTNVNGRMDSLDFADQINIADFEDLSEGARQIVKSNCRFDTLSEETRPDLLDLGKTFQSEPGKYCLARSVTFYRNGIMSDLGSNEDGSELRARSLCQNEIPSFPKAEFCDVNMNKSKSKGDIFERHWRQKENRSREMVKKNTGNAKAKNMTHSVQADGDASDELGGRDMRKLESHSKFNSFSTSAQQSEEICTRARPLYWREKENGSKDRTETEGRIVFQQRSKPEHKIPCLQSQSGHKKLCNDSKHTDLPEKSRWLSNPKDEQKFQTFVNEQHGPLLKVGEPSSSKDTFQFVDGINRQEVIQSKETMDTDKKVRENKGVPTSKCKKMIKQKYKTMKQEDEMNPKSKKIQHSLSCFNVSNVAENGSDLGVCTNYRLGDGLKYKFEVQNIESIAFNRQRNTKVTLPFPSKVVPKKAKTFLQQSNKTSTTKLLTYIPEQKMRKFIVLDPNKTESRFEQHLKIIVERATYALGLHKSKINEKSKRVMKLKKFKSEKKNKREIKLEKREGGELSLREFENPESEIKATKDKCKELELQMKEFCSYIQCVYGKLEEIKNSVKFETKMNEIMIAFGIECRRLSEALPIYARRSDILSEVKNSQVSVILGETGSGKSTQMTQYLYQAGFAEHGLIACTQPRKIAAVTLATFVASEMASSVGQIVGYHVGMKVKRTKITKILYMTDHILLNECLKDNELKNFSCIIIDEAHERSIFTDLLLGMIKSALKKRPDLKVIITSATINPDVFVSYFGGPEKCPVVRVSGRAYPVEVKWLNQVDDQNPFDDYVNKAVNTAVNLHRQNPPADGDILVFLTTPLETEKCCEEFVQKCPTDDSFQCLPLHGKLQPEEQQKVFQPNRPNKRKVVFATNSAETSITIPGVKFVVDTGLAKEMRFDPKRNVSSLSVYPISQSSAEQRKGRAGRTSPGKCYRLYNEKTYETMEKSTKPEILRVHLGQALLKLLELGVDPLSFDFVELPSREALENAMQSLCEIGAVEDDKISKLGWWISKLPIEPRQGLLLKKGILAGIPMEALVVASFSGGGGTFYRSGTEEEKKKADIKK